MSKSKVGELNPMFNKEKSKEFIAYMSRDRRGPNNPMFGKPKSEETLAKLRKKVYVYDNNKQFIKSEETLAKLRKKVYVYDNNKQFIKCYDSIKLAVKNLHIAAETIKKYLDTDKLYKNKYFFSKLQ
jgi:group I intron endonuclease